MCKIPNIQLNTSSPYLTGACAPQVHTSPEANTQQIPRRPVHQVEVEVVLQLGGVQHLKGDLGDLAGWLTRRSQELVATRGGRRRKEERERH